MKRLLVFFMAIFTVLLCSREVEAATGNVNSVSAVGTKNSVEISGTVSSDDIFAVAIQVRDKSGTLLTMESTGVTNGAFSITLTGLSFTADTAYDVYVADYDGGDWKTTEFTVPKDDDPGNNPGNDPGNTPGNDPGNTPDNDPGNTPGNNPGNTPGNDPGNTPDNAPDNTPDNTPVNSNGNISGNKKTILVMPKEPAGQPEEKPTEMPEEKPEEKATDTPTEKSEEKPQELTKQEEKDVLPEIGGNEPTKEPQSTPLIEEPIAVEDKKSSPDILKICLFSLGGIIMLGLALTAYFAISAGKKHKNEE